MDGLSNIWWRRRRKVTECAPAAPEPESAPATPEPECAPATPEPESAAARVSLVRDMDVGELAEALRSMTPPKQLSVLRLWPPVEFPLDNGATITARTKKEQRRYTRAMDPAMVAWLGSFEAGDVFYDVGANCGSLTIAAGVMHRDAIKIVALEPTYSSFESLVRNLAQNDMLGFTIPLQVALLDRSALQPLYYANMEPGTSSHAVGKPFSEGREFEPVAVQWVPTYSLDDLVRMLELPPPTRVKIDTDGAEISVLNGMAETLAAGTVKELSVEISDHDRSGARRDAIQALLERHGYEVHDSFLHHSTDTSLSPGETADFLFRRRGGAAAVSA